MEELEILIPFIYQKYRQMYGLWENNESKSLFNLRKIQVKDIYSNDDIFNWIIQYRLFLNTINLELSIELNQLGLKSDINTRVKAQNSIEYKIDNYIKKHNEGKEQLNKCLNDLYGIRIILSEKVDYETIYEYIKEKYPDIKCIDSTKVEGYVATHLYFKLDNYYFPWELQIWDKGHEMSNIVCHEKYKQDYTKWEMESKRR